MKIHTKEKLFLTVQSQLINIESNDGTGKSSFAKIKIIHSRGKTQN